MLKIRISFARKNFQITRVSSEGHMLLLGQIVGKVTLWIENGALLSFASMLIVFSMVDYP